MKTYEVTLFLNSGNKKRTTKEKLSIAMLDKNALKIWVEKYIEQDMALQSLCVGYEISTKDEGIYTALKDQTITMKTGAK